MSDRNVDPNPSSVILTELDLLWSRYEAKAYAGELSEQDAALFEVLAAVIAAVEDEPYMDIHAAVIRELAENMSVAATGVRRQIAAYRRVVWTEGRAS